jgi:hypothetical protein
MEYTPKPWKLVKKEADVVKYFEIARMPHGIKYDTVVVSKCVPLSEEWKCNENLIIHSPEAYELLKIIVAMNGVGYKDEKLFVKDLQPFIEDARKLIKKIETIQ